MVSPPSLIFKFKIMSDTTNKLENVDAQFAVSAQNLADALGRVGESAQDASVSFDELAAATAVNHLLEEEARNAKNAKFNARLFGAALILLVISAIVAKYFGV